jgi:hypothetical protein
MRVNGLWMVVTSQVSDGHVRDTYFVTYDKDAVNKYADAVYPLLVCMSRHLTQDDAWNFVREYLIGYEEINPLTI